MKAPDSQIAHKGPKQRRSRARKAALLEQGVALLNERDLDELSVARITQTLGYSTGSFYSYFNDKSDFFVEVQIWVNRSLEPEISRVFAPNVMTSKSLGDRLDACVSFAISYFREHTGLIRSALNYERRIPQGWAPNRSTTQRITSAACLGLNTADSERLEIAIQLAFGMLVNALLHDPGPLRLSDPKTGPRIAEALKPYLCAKQ